MEPFDLEAFDKQVGVTPDTDPVSVNDLNLPSEDQQALSQAAAQKPTGVSAPVTPATENVPEYLKEHFTAKPTVEPIDWGTELAKLTGNTPAEGTAVTADDFHRESAERYGYQHYLDQTPGYKQLFDEVNRDYSGTNGETQKLSDLKATIQNAVKQQLGEFASAGEVQTKLSNYIDDDGNLTDIGEKYGEHLLAQKKQMLNDVQAEAKKWAKEFADSNLDGRKKFDTFIMNEFKPTGVELPQEDKEYLRDLVLSGKIHQRLENLSQQELASVAVALDPYLFGRLAKAHYEKGSSVGANARLAQRLS
nr:hypothetical protein [uncultured Arsenicibacter sp.]